MNLFILIILFDKQDEKGRSLILDGFDSFLTDICDSHPAAEVPPDGPVPWLLGPQKGQILTNRKNE
jgi:hypothetical protein